MKMLQYQYLPSDDTRMLRVYWEERTKSFKENFDMVSPLENGHLDYNLRSSPKYAQELQRPYTLLN